MTETGDWLGLRGRVCVVTGAGGGLGRALAGAFAGAGARLALLDLTLEAAQAARASLPDGDALALACDVADPDSVAAAAAAVEERLGTATVLINNAALLRPGPLETLGFAEWNALLAVNLTGYFLCAQAFGRGMRAAGGGSLVHVASIAASHAQGFSGAYSVSKAGIVMLSRQIATEWGPAGIRSNVVSPGLVVTPLSQPFYDDADARARREAAVPMGRIGRPRDVAEAALYLASERASYVTGEEIVVDGGFTRGVMNLIPRPGFADATSR